MNILIFLFILSIKSEFICYNDYYQLEIQSNLLIIKLNENKNDNFYCGISIEEENSKQIKIIQIDDLIEILPEKIFRNFLNVEKIIFGKNIKEIKTNLFEKLFYLKEIEISEENDYFISLNNIIYSKDMKELIFYPIGIENEYFYMNENVEIIRKNSIKQTNLKKIFLSSNLKIIENFAFYLNEQIEEIIIPSTVSSIGKYSFSNCFKLKTVYLGNETVEYDETTFEGCENINIIIVDIIECGINCHSFLKTTNEYYFYGTDTISTTELFENKNNVKTLFIEFGMKKIEGNAFENFINVQNIIIPNSIETINNNPFRYCSKLTNIDFEENDNFILENKTILSKDKTKLFSYLNSNTDTIVYLPDYIKEIGGYAISENTKIETLIIEHEIDTIEDYGISSCSKLKSVVYLKMNSFSCGMNVLENCDLCPGIIVKKGYQQTQLGIKSPEIQNEETCGTDCKWFNSSTGIFVIYGTGSMTSYTAGGSYAWYKYKKSNTLILIEYGITNLPNYGFYSWSLLTHAKISDSVTSIGNYGFNGCSKLSTLIMGKSVESIGNFCFLSCSKLTSITLPETLLNIGESAFKSSGLTSIIIPDSVTTIGDNAFF